MVFLLACAGKPVSVSEPVPTESAGTVAEPVETVAEPPAARLPLPPPERVEDEGGWCAHYYRLLEIESKRGEETAGSLEDERLSELKGLGEAMGHHPAGVNMALVELEQVPLTGDAQLTEAVIAEHWGAINGYVGPACGL